MCKPEIPAAVPGLNRKQNRAEWASVGAELSQDILELARGGRSRHRAHITETGSLQRGHGLAWEDSGTTHAGPARCGFPLCCWGLRDRQV